MKKLLFIFGFLICIFPITTKAAVATSVDKRDLNIHLFTNNDCQNCEKIKKYVEEKHKENTRIILNEINVEKEKDIYTNTKKILNFKDNKYPVIIIGSNYFYKLDTKKLDKVIESYLENDNYCDLVYRVKSNLNTDDCLELNKDIYKSDNNLIIIIIITVIIIITGLIIFKLIKDKKIKINFKKNN